MEKRDAKTIEVRAGWLEGDPLIGLLRTERGRDGKERSTFSYDESWLGLPSGALVLDPMLERVPGPQPAPAPDRLHGFLEDSCPDRWGRTLMRRREAAEASREGRRARQLAESDYLVGVDDATRMGALRLKVQGLGAPWSSDEAQAVPPLARLRTLESAAWGLDGGKRGGDWLRDLVSPGSSLGGARPKANVVDGGGLWIAKFPSRNDDGDVGAWEAVCWELARLCRIDVPEGKTAKASRHGTTFLSKRFDRVGPRRIHFASAMTMLGERDGSDSGKGYLDIAGFVEAHGARPRADKRELWRRVVFEMAVSNTDGHLRNHGFLLAPDGWRLSPAYDLNPDPEGEYLSLTVDGADSRMDFELAVEAAPCFGVGRDEAVREVKGICRAVEQSWRALARKHGLRKGEVSDYRPAFDMGRKNLPALERPIVPVAAAYGDFPSSPPAAAPAAREARERAGDAEGPTPARGGAVALPENETGSVPKR